MDVCTCFVIVLFVFVASNELCAEILSIITVVSLKVCAEELTGRACESPMAARTSTYTCINTYTQRP